MPKGALEVGAEMQVVTELQETWNSITHGDFYKTTKGVPKPVRNRVYRLAAAVNLLDEEMKEIHKQLNSLRKDQHKKFIEEAFGESWKT